MIELVDGRRLLSDGELEASAVVANNAMNRERGLAGVNSYTKDLGFDPLALLQARAETAGRASWLDLCCGSGRAAIEAAKTRHDIQIVGVDLVDYFDRHEDLPQLKLITSSLAAFHPDRTFDLITCVHGLHYVGDKLGMLARALTWLAPDGFLIAHLDLGNIKIGDSGAVGDLKRLLAAHGIEHNARRHVVSRRGPTVVDFGLRYLGADDHAGPNYTGQPAVNSIYARP
jgi:SAM-dependent methyltransferase